VKKGVKVVKGKAAKIDHQKGRTGVKEDGKLEGKNKNW